MQMESFWNYLFKYQAKNIITEPLWSETKEEGVYDKSGQVLDSSWCRLG